MKEVHEGESCKIVADYYLDPSDCWNDKCHVVAIPCGPLTMEELKGCLVEWSTDDTEKRNNSKVVFSNYANIFRQAMFSNLVCKGNVNKKNKPTLSTSHTCVSGNGKGCGKIKLP